MEHTVFKGCNKMCDRKNWMEPLFNFMATGEGTLEDALNKAVENLNKIIYEEVKKQLEEYNEQSKN